MAETYGRVDAALCKGLGGSMHLTDVEARFPRHLRHRGRRHSPSRRAPPGRRRSARKQKSCIASSVTAPEAGAHSTRPSNIASLWKLPVIFVMENNGYNVVTTSEQEDANAANGEPLSVKRQSVPRCRASPSMALIHWRCTPPSVRQVERARAGAGPTLVESKVYRLSACTATSSPRPACRCTTPEHEAITVFGRREEYEAALRGDPVPRFRATLVEAGVLNAAKADELAAKIAKEMAAAVDFAVKSPFPKLESALDNVYA